MTTLTTEDFEEVGEIETISLSGGTLYGVAFSHDGSLLACAGKDRICRLYNPQTRELVRQLTGMTNEINGIGWSHTSMIIGACGDDKTLRLWNAVTGELLTTKEDFSEVTYSVDFSYDGAWVAASGKSRTNIYDMRSGDYSQTHSISDSSTGWRRISFSPVDSMLAVPDDHDVKIYDVRTGEAVVEVATGHSNDVRCVRWTRDGELIATASKDNSIRVFRWVTQQCLAKLEGHSDWTNNLRFFAGDTLLISSSDDRDLRIWDWNSNETSEDTLASLTDDDDSPKKGRHLKTMGGHDGNIYGMDVSPDESMVACNSSGNLKIWSLPSSIGNWHRIDVKALSEIQSKFLRRKKLDLDLGQCDGSEMSSRMLSDIKALRTTDRDRRMLAKKDLYNAVLQISMQLDERTIQDIIVGQSSVLNTKTVESTTDAGAADAPAVSSPSSEAGHSGGILSGPALFQTCLDCLMCPEIDEYFAVLFAGLLFRIQPENTPEGNSMLATLVQAYESMSGVDTSDEKKFTPRSFVKSLLEMSAIILYGRMEGQKSTKMSLFSPKCDFHTFVDRGQSVNFAECAVLCDLLIAEFMHKCRKQPSQPESSAEQPSEASLTAGDESTETKTDEAGATAVIAETPAETATEEEVKEEAAPAARSESASTSPRSHSQLSEPSDDEDDDSEQKVPEVPVIPTPARPSEPEEKNAARYLWNCLAKVAAFNVKRKRDWRIDALLINAFARAALMISTIPEPKADDPDYDGTMDEVIEESVSQEVISSMIKNTDVEKPGIAFFLNGSQNWQCQCLAAAYITHFNSLCESVANAKKDSEDGDASDSSVPISLLISLPNALTPLSSSIMEEWDDRVAMRLYGYVHDWNLKLDHFDDYDWLVKAEGLLYACRAAIDLKVVGEMLDDFEKLGILTNPLPVFSFMIRACLEFGCEMEATLAIEASVESSPSSSDESKSKDATPDRPSLDKIRDMRRRCVQVTIGRLLCVNHEDVYSDVAIPLKMIEYWLPSLTIQGDMFQPLFGLSTILKALQTAYKNAAGSSSLSPPKRSIAIFQSLSANVSEEKKDDSGLESKVDSDTSAALGSSPGPTGDEDADIALAMQLSLQESMKISSRLGGAGFSNLSSVIVGMNIGEATFASEVVAYLLGLPSTATSREVVKACQQCLSFVFPRILDDRIASILIPIISSSTLMAKEFAMDTQTISDSADLMSAVNSMDLEQSMQVLDKMKSGLDLSKLKNHVLLLSALFRIRFELFVNVEQFTDEAIEKVGGPDKFMTKVLPLMCELRRRIIAVLLYVCEAGLTLSRVWMSEWSEKIRNSFMKMESALMSLNNFKDDASLAASDSSITDPMRVVINEEMSAVTRKYFAMMNESFKELQILHLFFHRFSDPRSSGFRATRGSGGGAATADSYDFGAVKQAHKFTQHSATIYGLSFSSDCDRLVTGSKDRSCRLLSAQDHSEIHHFQGHTNEINGVSCSLDGLWAASAADDEEVRVWNLMNPSASPKVLSHSDKVWHTSWSRSGHWLAAAAKNAIRIWDTGSWDMVYSITDDTTSWRRLHFNPMDEDILAVPYEQEIRIYNVRTKVQVKSISGDFTSDIRAVRFNQGGDLVAACSKCKSCRIYSWNTGTRVANLVDHHTDWVNNVRWLADDAMVVTVSDDKKVSFWSVETESVKHTITSSDFSGNIYSLDISEDGNWMAFGSDETVFLYELPGSSGSWFKSGSDYATLLDSAGIVKVLPFNETAQSYVQDLVNLMSMKSPSKSPRKIAFSASSLLKDHSKRKNIFDVITVISKKRESGELKIAPLFAGLVQALVIAGTNFMFHESYADALTVLSIGSELRKLVKQAVSGIVDTSKSAAELKGGRNLVKAMVATIQAGVEKIAMVANQHVGYFTGTQRMNGDVKYEMIIVNQLEIVGLIAGNGLDLSERITMEMESKSEEEKTDGTSAASDADPSSSAAKKKKKRQEPGDLKSLLKEDVSWEDASALVARGTASFVEAPLLIDLIFDKLSGEVALKSLFEFSEAVMRRNQDWRIVISIMAGLCRLAMESPAYGKQAVESMESSKKGISWYLSNASEYQSRLMAADIISYFVKNSAYSISSQLLISRVRLEWDDRVALRIFKCLEEWGIPNDYSGSDDCRYFTLSGALVSEMESLIHSGISDARKGIDIASESTVDSSLLSKVRLKLDSLSEVNTLENPLPFISALLRAYTLSRQLNDESVVSYVRKEVIRLCLSVKRVSGKGIMIPPEMNKHWKSELPTKDLMIRILDWLDSPAATAQIDAIKSEEPAKPGLIVGLFSPDVNEAVPTAECIVHLIHKGNEIIQSATKAVVSVGFSRILDDRVVALLMPVMDDTFASDKVAITKCSELRKALENGSVSDAVKLVKDLEAIDLSGLKNPILFCSAALRARFAIEDFVVMRDVSAALRRLVVMITRHIRTKGITLQRGLIQDWKEQLEVARVKLESLVNSKKQSEESSSELPGVSNERRELEIIGGVLQRLTQIQKSVMDADEEAEFKVMKHHGGTVYGLSWSSDGMTIASGSKDHKIGIWSGISHDFVREIVGHTNEINDVRIAPNCKQVASTADDKTVRVFDIESGEQVTSLDIAENGWTCCFSFDGTLLGAAAKSNVYVWNTNDWSLKHHWPDGYTSWRRIDWHPSLPLLGGSEDSDVKVYDAASGSNIKTMSGQHTNDVRCVRFSQNGKMLASVSKDKSVCLWNWENEECLWRNDSEHSDWTNNIQWMNQDSLVLSSSDDKDVVIWDVASQEVVRKLSGHTGNVYSLDISPDGLNVIAGSGSDFRLWTLPGAFGNWLRLPDDYSVTLELSGMTPAFKPHDCTRAINAALHKIQREEAVDEFYKLLEASGDLSGRPSDSDGLDEEGLGGGEDPDLSDITYNEPSVKLSHLFSGLLRTLKHSKIDDFLTLLIGTKLRKLVYSADVPTAQAMVATVANATAGMSEGLSLFQMQTVALIAHSVPDESILAKAPKPSAEVTSPMASSMDVLAGVKTADSGSEEVKSAESSDPSDSKESESDIAAAAEIAAREARKKKQKEMSESIITLFGDVLWENVSQFIDKGVANTVEAAMLTDIILKQRKDEDALQSLWRMISRLRSANIDSRVDSVFIEALAYLAQKYPNCRADAFKSVDPSKPGLAYYLECPTMASRQTAVHTLAYLAACGKEEVSMTALGLLIPRLHMESDERVITVIIHAMEEYKLPVTSFKEDRIALDTAALMVKAVVDEDEAKAQEYLSKLAEIKTMKNPRPLLGYFLRACVSSKADSELRKRLVTDCIRAALCVTLPDGTTISISPQMSQHWSEQLKSTFGSDSTMSHTERILKTVVSRLTDEDKSPLRSCLTCKTSHRPGIAHYLYSTNWEVIEQTMEVVRYLLANGSDDVKDLATEIVYKRYQIENSYESAMKFASIAEEFFDEDSKALRLSAQLDQAVLDDALPEVERLLREQLEELDVSSLANPFILLRSVLSARLAVFCKYPEIGVNVRKFAVNVRRHGKTHRIEIKTSPYRAFITEAVSLLKRQMDEVDESILKPEKRDLGVLVAIIERMIRSTPIFRGTQSSTTTDSGDESGVKDINVKHDIAEHSGTIYGISFSEDCSMLASGGKDRKVVIYNPETRVKLKTLEGHTNEVNHVVFAPDSVRLSSCGDDRTVRIWDALSGTCVKVLEGFEEALWSTAWSFDCSLLATAAKNQWRVYRVSDWSMMHSHNDGCTSWRRIGFNTMDYTLAVSNDSTGTLYNAELDESLTTLNGHSSDIRAMVFSRSGEKIATCSKDKDLRVWSVSTGDCLFNFQGHTDWSNNVRWMAGDNLLVSCSDDRKLKFWDVQSKKEIHSLDGHEGNVYSLDVTSNDTLIACGNGGNIRIWELPDSFSNWFRVSTDFSVCLELFGVAKPMTDAGEVTSALLAAIQAGNRRKSFAEFKSLKSSSESMFSLLQSSLDLTGEEEETKSSECSAELTRVLQLFVGLIVCLSDEHCDDYTALLLGRLLRNCCLAISEESQIESMVATLVEARDSLVERPGMTASPVAIAQLELCALLVHGKPEATESDMPSLYSDIPLEQALKMIHRGAGNFVEASLVCDLAFTKLSGRDCLTSLFAMCARCARIGTMGDGRLDCLLVDALARLARQSPELVKEIVEGDSRETRGIAFFLRNGHEHCRAAVVGILAEFTADLGSAEASAMLSDRAKLEWNEQVTPELYSVIDEWELKMDGFEDSSVLRLSESLLKAVHRKDLATAKENLDKLAGVKAMQNPLPLVSSLLRSMLVLRDDDSAEPLRRQLTAQVVRFQLSVPNADGDYASVPREMASYWKTQLSRIDQPQTDPDLPAEGPVSPELKTVKAIVNSF